MRSFIGINFSREVKEDISRIQRQIRENAAKGRFKHVDNFHITIKFLGEINQNQAKAIADRLAQIAACHKPFELGLQDIGCFKGRESIRTLYISLGGETDALQQLNQAVEAAMEQVGFPKESRPYTPHITISQDLVLNMPYEQLKSQLNMADTHRIQVEKIELIKSEQIQNKRIYTPIYSYQLEC